MRYSPILWALCLLFSLRVIGQALQLWLPQSFLPPFSAFQGSNLPYWSLLLSQLVILAVMGRVSWRVTKGLLVPRRRLGNILGWLGGVYMVTMLARLVIGLALPAAAPWFKAWIPSVFHVVLAAFLLTVSVYHRRESQ